MLCYISIVNRNIVIHSLNSNVLNQKFIRHKEWKQTRYKMQSGPVSKADLPFFNRVQESLICNICVVSEFTVIHSEAIFP